MSQLRGDQSRAPRIILTSADIANGETLSGTLENLGSGSVELLLITDKGQIKNLSDLLKPGLDSMSFSIGLQSGDTGVRPQLLLALTSSRPIGALKQAQLKTANEFFDNVLSEARRNNALMAVSVRYFRLGG
jgi:serine/threonine protein kinase, bacterial